jgi:hypothetical protein
LGFAVVAGLLLAGPALADDSTAPTVGNATVIDETTFELEIEDDGGVDEGSIAASDFALSSGSIDAIQANESGNDSVVTVTTTDPVRSHNTTITLEGAIADDAGNERTDGNATVVGIDGYPPFLKEYSVAWIENTTLRIEFYVDEPVHNASVSVSGPQDESFDRSDFREEDTPPGNEYRYWTNHTIEEEGEYEITLASVTDSYGNTQQYYNDRRALQDRTDPIARVDGPQTASVGEPVSYVGGQSDDDRTVSAYEWAVDGTVVGTTATLGHVFETAGRHEVALTVTDGRDNADSTKYPIEVLEATTTADVAITPTNGTGVDIAIGPNRSLERVLVDRPGGLAGNGSAVLDALVFTVPINGSATLSTDAATGAPAEFDGGAAIETVTVEHGTTPVSDVTFRFSVNRSAIAAAGLDSGDVTMYRESGGWTRLPTLRVADNETHVQYRATAPGLSQFVIGGAEAVDGGTVGDGDAGGQEGNGDGSDQPAEDASDGEPAFAIVDGRLLTRNVSAGDPMVVRATVANDGTASGTYVAGLSVNGTVLRTTQVTVPPGELREVTIAETATAGGNVTVNGTRVGAVAMTGGSGVDGGDGGNGFSVPVVNPLSLWPGGLFGRVMGAVFWLVVILYGALKGLALYLGY